MEAILFKSKLRLFGSCFMLSLKLRHFLNFKYKTRPDKCKFNVNMWMLLGCHCDIVETMIVSSWELK